MTAYCSLISGGSITPRHFGQTQYPILPNTQYRAKPEILPGIPLDTFLENLYYTLTRAHGDVVPAVGTESNGMRKVIIGISLFAAFIAAGCTNTQLHQSLLMNENRQLEDALYVAHAQITDLKRENDALRGQQANGYSEPPGRSGVNFWEEEWEDAIPVEMPRVILSDEEGTTEVPDFLRGSDLIPTWSPVR